jgi:hypothetical protein
VQSIQIEQLHSLSTSREETSQWQQRNQKVNYKTVIKLSTLLDSREVAIYLWLC